MQEYQGTKYIEKKAPLSPKQDTEQKPLIFWGHGWGQSHASFLSLCEPLEHIADHILVDFPGFGESPVPPDVWGTREYADHMAHFIRSKIGDNKNRPVLWVGHSFGCRVGLQLAAHYPDLFQGLFLIAAAGIPKKLPLFKSLYFKMRIKLYKFLKRLIPLGLPESWLIKTFGSADYQNADPILRKILVKVVNENLSDIAPHITCPVQFVYGENDDQTPPETGRVFSDLIPNAKLVILNRQDHYSVLSSGRHPVTQQLKAFISSFNPATDRLSE